MLLMLNWLHWLSAGLWVLFCVQAVLNWLLLADLQHEFANLRVVQGQDPPAGWLG